MRKNINTFLKTNVKIWAKKNHSFPACISKIGTYFYFLFLRMFGFHIKILR